jgi:hypothetical protein
MKLLHAPRGKLKAKSPKRIKLARAMGLRVVTNESGAKVSSGLKTTRKSQRARNH